VLADEPNAPSEGIRTRPCNSGVDERVEHASLVLTQPGHHRDREVGEGHPCVADARTPRDLAAVPGLGLVGDLHPLLAGLLPEAADAAERCCGPGRVVGVCGDLRCWQLTDDGDLFAVDGDFRLAGEPSVGQPAGQPGRRVVGGGKVGLLPAAGPAEAASPAAMSVVSHAYSSRM
jgi:hypothetical protein